MVSDIYSICCKITVKKVSTKVKGRDSLVTDRMLRFLPNI